MEVFPERAAEKVGFPAVRARIVAECRSAPGAERASGRSPCAPEEAAVRLARTARLQDRLRFGDPLPEASFEPVDEALRQSAPLGSFLEPEELSAVRTVAVAARRLHAWLSGSPDEDDVLAGLAATMVPLPTLERTIDALLDADGRLREDASPHLRRLRRDGARMRDRLRVELLDTLRKAGSEGWATEDQPTIRGGRMVIPLRAEAKRKMSGIVHDVSATGQTAFFEPSACVELNNELRDLEAEERREVIRLLTEATDGVREHRHELAANQRALAEIDVLVATARVSNRLDALTPERGEGGVIDLKEARNPELLLRAAEREAVVPLSIRIDEATRMIVISGPNAGGKSVALKTVGLFALMLASGIPVPCAPASRFDRFDRLFVEIGDDQSVADDLSTFSSHLAHLREILDRSDDRSIVLVDEAGSGTDPDEGSAMAQAILESLLDRGARCMVTTHHGPLKRFAHDMPGVSNGMMSFDRESLRPTFRFVPGVPGASYAFEIADRLGIDRAVVERSKVLLGTDRAAFEQLLADLDQRNRDLERRVAEAAEAARGAEISRGVLQQRLSSLQEGRSDIRRRAIEEAERVLAEANAAVERAVREIRESQADAGIVRAARTELAKVQTDLRKARQRGERKGTVRPAGRAAAGGEIGLGDQVVVDGSGPSGEVLEMRGDEAVVVMGTARMRVAVKRLVKVGGRKAQQVTVRQVSADPSGWVATAARTRIDLRGRRVDEALSEVVRFVDEAVAAGLDRAEILHGKGTGALRAAVHEYLSSRPDVSAFDEAPVEQGGAGITVITL